VTEVILAKRMGVDVDDRRRRLVASIFASTIVTACGDLITDTDTFRLGRWSWWIASTRRSAAGAHHIGSAGTTVEYEVGCNG